MGRIWMTGGGGGADLDVVTAGPNDVLNGKVIVDREGNPLNGTMPNRGAVSKELQVGTSYTIPRGYHNGNGVVRAKTLDAITANASDVLTGKVIVDREGNPLNGTMPNRGAVSKELQVGTSYTIPRGYHNGNGVVRAKTKNIKMISAGAIRGFGDIVYDQTSEVNQFTIPSGALDCMVYYGGVSADNKGAGDGLCRIYRGAAGTTLVDNRDVTGNSYLFRGTMTNKSFSASAGETIKVECTTPSGSHVLCFIQAVIEYYT